jgi:putative phosphoesterase
MTLIGLISDVHAAPDTVAEAFSLFTDAGVDDVFCAGDIAGYMNELEPTIRLLIEHDCKTVVGNHDLLYLEHNQGESNDCITYLNNLPLSYETVIEGKKVYMVHAQPPASCHGGIKLLDKHGELMADRLEQWAETLSSFDYDILIVGHTHQVFVEKIAGMLVINPGSTVFNNCCAILRLPEMSVELYPLAGKEIQRTWNWGEHVIYAGSK